MPMHLLHMLGMSALPVCITDLADIEKVARLQSAGMVTATLPKWRELPRCLGHRPFGHPSRSQGLGALQAGRGRERKLALGGCGGRSRVSDRGFHRGRRGLGQGHEHVRVPGAIKAERFVLHEVTRAHVHARGVDPQQLPG